MFKKSHFIGASIISICSLLVTSISLSIAWFKSANRIPTNDPENGIKGTSLSSYFHVDANYEGDGSLEKPFVITRPVHWENLIWLHNNLPEFFNPNKVSVGEGEEARVVDKGFYYRIGHPLVEGSDEMYVYSYNDKGRPVMNDGGQPEVSKVLNLSLYSNSGKELIPLGSPQYPFIGTLDGNNITLSNFKIVSFDADNDNVQLEDIGVFGYVGETAEIRNLYFTNYTIDTSKATMYEGEAYSTHTAHDNESVFGEDLMCPCIGTIAGHVFRADCFSDVYSNNCKIEGTASGYKHHDRYGYYGCVESDFLGGSTGKGSDYSFYLDADTVYNYFDANYANIRSNPVRVEGSDYDFKLPSTDFADNQTILPISSAVSHNNNTYTLNGVTPSTRNSYSGFNYSLSTLGYAELDPNSVDKVYELGYLDSKNNNKFTLISDEPDQMRWNYGTPFADASKGYEEFSAATYNVTDPNNPYWDYYHVHNDGDLETRRLKININISTSWDHSGRYTQSNPDCTDEDYFCFFDGKEIGTSNAPAYDSVNFNAWTTNYKERVVFGADGTVTINMSLQASFYVDVQVGTHYVGAVGYTGHDLTSGMPSRHYMYYGSNCVRETYNTVYHRMKVTQLPIEVTKDMPVASSGQVTEINLTTFKTGTGDSCNTATSDGASFIRVTPDVFSEDYINPTKILGREAGKDPVTMVDSQMSPVCNTYNTYDEEGNITDTDYTWTYTQVAPKELATDDSGGHIKKFVHQTINDYMPVDEEGNKREYRPKNIDIVGGGVGFYKQNFLGLNLSIINLPAERYNDTTILGQTLATHYNTLTPENHADGGIGTPFYATKYCPNSIVMMMKNTANAADNRDDSLGTIGFTYVNVQLNGQNNISITQPVFKKGRHTSTARSFVNISTLHNEDSEVVEEEQEQGQGATSATTYVPSEITEMGARKSCYCALDKYGNIILTFENDGSIRSRSSMYATDQEALLAIDTYVMALGAQGYGSCYITQIDFAYKAKDGYGGTFGSVGFRSPDSVSAGADREESQADGSKITVNYPNKINDTIINVYFEPPEGSTYSCLINYVGYGYDDNGVPISDIANTNIVDEDNNKIPRYCYIIEFTCSQECTLNIFNYDTTNYCILLKAKVKDSLDNVYNYNYKLIDSDITELIAIP